MRFPRRDTLLACFGILALLLLFIAQLNDANAKSDIVALLEHRVSSDQGLLSGNVGKSLFSPDGFEQVVNSTDSLKSPQDYVLFLFRLEDCPSCLGELGILNGLASGLPKGLAMVGVCIGCGERGLDAIEERWRPRFPLLSVTNELIEGDYLWFTPYRVLLDSEGVVVKIAKVDSELESKSVIIDWMTPK